MRNASPKAEKISPARIFLALEWAPKKPMPWARRNTQRQKMGRHLMRALNQEGLEVGNHRTKYTQVALKNGTSFGPSLLTCTSTERIKFYALVVKLINMESMSKYTFLYHCASMLLQKSNVCIHRLSSTCINLLCVSHERCLSFNRWQRCDVRGPVLHNWLLVHFHDPIHLFMNVNYVWIFNTHYETGL